MPYIPYIYEAEVIRWVDGDTVELVVDLGFYQIFGRSDRPITFRLHGMDTPERGEENFDKATEFAENMAPVGSTILIESMKNSNGELSDDFGRYIARVYVGDNCVNDALVASGLAVASYV